MLYLAYRWIDIMDGFVKKAGLILHCYLCKGGVL